MRLPSIQRYLLLSLALTGCAAQHQLLEQPVAVTCQPQVIDTSRWVRRAVDQLFTVLLPQDMEPDTTVQASIQFYHGGGRFRAAALTFGYDFQIPDQVPHLERPADWLPGERACFPSLTKGWEARAAAARREDGLFIVSAWFRRPERPHHWLMVTASGRDASEVQTLVRIVAGVAPDSSFWRTPH